MSFQKHLIEGIAHASKHARAHGEGSKANGLILIALGIVTLWIPIIGVPLLIWGIVKLCR